MRIPDPVRAVPVMVGVMIVLRRRVCPAALLFILPNLVIRQVVLSCRAFE
jgi:hypothetical protein